MEEKKKKTEALLRAVLISSPRGVPLRRLDKEYRTVTFSSIPFQEMGYHSLEHYIKSIPNVAMLTRDVDGEFVVKGVASESDQHVAKLIAKQRKPKKKAPKANSRRPVFVRRPTVITRPAMTRQVLMTRPPVVQVVRPLPAAPRPTGTGIRFIPPRMMRQAVSQATANSVAYNLIQRGVSRQVQQQAQTLAAASVNSTRKVEVVSQPVSNRTLVQQPATSPRSVTVAPNQGESVPQKSWKKKPKSPASGPNWQGIELSDFGHKEGSNERVVYLSNSSASTNKIAPQSNPLTEEDMKIYSRIKQLIADKPKGLWLKRIGAEYKKAYGDELSSEKLERLKTLPDIARCEEYTGGHTIVYPLNLTEEKPLTKPTRETNGDSPRAVEVYTLRPQDMPAKGTSSEVSVSHVDNPAHFFVHHKHNWDTIDSLSSKLNEFYQNQSNKTDLLLAVEPGMFCCAQFSEDHSWYRARITESSNKDDTSQVEVIYVDFGNHEPLPVSQLRTLRKEHAELPMMAVLCALDGAVPSGGDTWSASSTDRFKELCAATEFLHMTVIRAEGHHLFVELKDTEGKDIKAVLQNEGHIGRDTPADQLSSSSSSSSSSSVLSSLTSSSSTDSFVSVTTVTSSTSSSLTNIVPTADSPSTEREDKESEERKGNTRTFLRHRFLSKDEEAQKIPDRVQIPDEQFVDVFVCNVHSTDNICVNLSGENYSEKLTALEQSMLCHYEEPSSEEVVKVNPGSIFAIYSKEIHSEGLWYRVKALKVKGDKVQIEYMDYGDTAMVPSSSLKNIPPRFLELPFQACTISLNGLPKTKNAEVVLKLKHMTLNKDLVAEVVKRSGNTASVELYDTSSEVADININIMLRSLVIPDEEMVPVLPKPGEQIDAFVTYVTLQGNMFIQIPGGGTTRLEELMEDISEHYSQPTKAAEFVSNPHKDKMCCAKCSDGAWYRAIVTKVLPDRQVEVQYVDYGNTEQLPVSSLREPTRAIGHVNSLPFQALECKLEGTDKLESLTEEQGYAIMERNVLLEVVQCYDVPLVRLFVPSEEDESALVNLAELIGLESEKQAEFQEEESTSAGNDDAVSEPPDDGSVDGDSVASESSSEASKSPEEGDKITIPPPLDFSQPWVDVYILEFVDPSLFMFQCLELLKQKEELENKIQEYYTGRSKTPFREIRPGVLCAVLNAEDNTWYRGVIKASLSPQQTCVRFADHGDFGIVPSTSLQALPDEFRELPLMAVQGCLHGVEPVGEDLAEWSEEARRRFEELTTGKKLVAKPRGAANHSRSTNEETKISLELYDTSKGNEDLLIADVLVNEGLARRINET